MENLSYIFEIYLSAYLYFHIYISIFIVGGENLAFRTCMQDADSTMLGELRPLCIDEVKTAFAKADVG